MPVQTLEIPSSRFQILNTRVDRRTFSSQHVALYTKNKIPLLKLIFVLLIYCLKYHNSSTYITTLYSGVSLPNDHFRVSLLTEWPTALDWQFLCSVSSLCLFSGSFFFHLSSHPSLGSFSAVAILFLLFLFSHTRVHIGIFLSLTTWCVFPSSRPQNENLRMLRFLSLFTFD